MNNDAKSQPLKGIRVLDFSHAAAAPFAAMFLGDMGAEVIKIEKIGTGDGARSMGVPMPMLTRRDSDYYVSLNRNKKGLAVDLTSADGRQIALDLTRHSDIVIQNFRPGVMERLGLGFDDLRALRPHLIYCSISAFGSDGPWASRPANDIIMQSVSGLMGITGEVGGGPVRIGAPISDFSTGLFGLAGILAAFIARQAHPEGQHVEVSMLEASLNMMCNYIPSVATLGAKVPRLGRGHAQIVPYQAFECADGEYVMVGAFTRQFWERLARAVGREDWTTDPRYSSNPRRLQNRDSLLADLQQIFRGRTRNEWLHILEEADVPNGPVLELHDAIRTEQAEYDNTLIDLGPPDHPFQVVRSPIRVAAWGEAPHATPPRLGENTAEVLSEILGYDAARIAALHGKGVVGLGQEATDTAAKPTQGVS